jgi:DNA-binding MarR family transcriptional regulator
MAGQYYRAETYEARRSIGYLLRRGRSLLTVQVERLFAEKFSDKDVTFAQWVVLMCLRDNLAKTSAEISQYICYDSGALTRLIDQMEERGLLKRKRSVTDRRIIELCLTPLGRKTVKSLIAVVCEFYNELLSDFTRREADTLIHLLSRVVTRLSVNSKKGG